MRGTFGNSEIIAREIDGHFRPGTDKIVRPLFGPVARVVWPFKPDAEIATIAGCDTRTARRYLRGELDAPAIVYMTMWKKIIESRNPTG